MKIETQHLIGKALDWAVGEVEFKRQIAQGSHVKQWVLDDHRKGLRTDPFSTDWLFGGPLVDHYGINLTTVYVLDLKSDDPYGAFLDDGQDVIESLYSGPTYLVAIARCCVAAALGEEVEVPDILC